MVLFGSKTRLLQRPLIQLFVHARHHSISLTRSSQNPVIPVIPELFSPNFLNQLIPPTSTPAQNENPLPAKANPMMDALREFSHRTLTENGAPAYDSTLSPTLDAFQKLTRYSWGITSGRFWKRCAWAEDPNLTLRIIWNLRSIHDGKSEKEAFYRAFGWLYDNHPRTAISNLHLLVEPVCLKSDQEKGLAHGYWKDLLNILALATVDELSNISQAPQFLHKFPARKTKGGKKIILDALVDSQPVVTPLSEKSNLGSLGIKVDIKPVVKAKRTVAGVANQARIERKLADPKYRALYVAVARLFAQRLLTDLGYFLKSEKADNTEERNALLRNISLAAKWAPSLLGTHDRHTNIATAISRLVFHGKNDFPTFPFPSALENHPTLESAEATGILRSFYRRWLLTPLRAASLVTETFMAANRWTEIQYNRISAVCMKNNNKHFFTHDPAGFQKYLISVEKGHRTISGATLLPHELVAEIYSLCHSAASDNRYPELQKHRSELSAASVRVVEAQWKTLVKSLGDAGTIENSVAICDVSGSMGSLHSFDSKNIQPIFPSVALSLLLAQLARPPFNGGFITFSADPQFVRLDPAASLYETIMRMNDAEWGMNTDIQAVFLRLLLPLAIQHKVKQEDMIKRVFVFSDMQFDEGALSTGAWDTNYDIIECAYKAAGYEVPQVVYWNLSNYDTVEVQADRKGVALMSGFSPSMLKIFMGEEVPEELKDEEGAAVPVEDKVEKMKAEFNPLNIMKKALSRPSFDGLVVVD
ncbi:hypothetical protein B0H19DRAFT_1142314 [Mycena capillaripes]|nr:hypothetical protein B0H19DRAFT_1142314 [Mycena capillaripes]